MASTIDRLRKRTKCPVRIGDETVYVRGLTYSEWNEIQPLREEAESNGIAIGWCLLADDGSAVFARKEGEALKDFGARVLTELDIEVGTGLYLAAKIIKVTQEPPDIEAVIKN